MCVSTESNWNTTFKSEAQLKPNTWSHIALVCSGLDCTLYIDGKVDSLKRLDTQPKHNSAPFYFGKCPAGVKLTSADYPGVQGRICSAYYAPQALPDADVRRLSKWQVTAAIQLTVTTPPLAVAGSAPAPTTLMTTL